MNVNDPSVLEMINRLIATDRLNKKQILQLVNLASISSTIKELKENMKWETFKSKYKKNIKNNLINAQNKYH